MKRKVLVVDDDSINRKMLRKILNTEYDVIEAENGVEALDILHKKNKIISAVLLDILMPVMDGFELLRKMRGNAVLSQIPVIVATASDKSDTEVMALSLGANDFVTKPYNPTLILHCLRNTINLRETASIVNAIQRDKLTGLYNRETFFEKASLMLKEKKPGSYIMSCFDIDGFKVINDQYGASEGDRILQHIGKATKEIFSQVGGISSRISADNFAALYPVENDILDFITEKREQEFVYFDNYLSINLSIGRYIVTDTSLSASAIYDRAYIAKQSVKGRYDTHVAYFSESMREKLLREQAIISEMDGALVQNHFEVWFQPQFNHSNGALIGAEALVRWRHPEKGLITPDDYIPVFEQNGFIYEMDKYVWEQTCQYIRKWIDDGYEAFPVSVNVSRYDVFREDFIDVITSLIEKYRIPKELLRLEITESAFAHSTEHIIAIVRKLMDFGLIVEIDDFGSGYSSLNTLKDVPATVLKLDMKFLEATDNSQRSGNIIESVIRMAKWLGMSVIAEGVETLEQADYLKSIGCYYVQGYLYSKPMPADDFEELFSNADKEQHLLTLKTVESLNNNTFWDPSSIETLIFNSYVGGACIFEYHNGAVELLRANDKYAKVIGSAGMTLEKALKLNWSEYLSKEALAELDQSLMHSIKTCDSVTCEFMFHKLPDCPDETYLRSTMRVIAYSGDHYLVYCTNENITAQIKAEKKEHQTAEHMSAIMSNINGGVAAYIIKNEQPQMLFANDEFYNQRGYTKEQYEKEVKLPSETIHPEDREEILRMTAAACQSRKPFTAIYRIIRRDGTRRWIQSNITITDFTDQPEPVQLAVSNDVTSLRETDEQLRFLNETAHNLLAQPDSEKGIEELLKKLLRYFGGRRAYIFEFNYETELMSNTYEVCAAGVESKKQKLRNLPLSLGSFLKDALTSKKFFNIESVETLGQNRPDKQLLCEQGIDSLIAVPLQRDGELIGLVGIDDPGERYALPERLAAIGDYIAVMITRRDLAAKIASDDKMLISLMNDTPGGFVRMRMESDGKTARPVYFNDGFCELVGMNRSELMEMYGNDAMAGVHPDDIAIVQEALSVMLNSGKARSMMYRLRHGQKGYVRLMFFGRVVKSESGETFLNVYYADDCDQSGFQVQEQVNESPKSASSETEASSVEILSAALKTVLESSGELGFIKDGQHRYLYCNSAFMRSLNIDDKKYLIGKTDYEIIDRKFAERYHDDELEILKSGLARLHYGEIIPTSDGLVRYAVTSKYPVIAPSGKTIGVYGTVLDLTKIHDIDPQLKFLIDSIPGGLVTYVCSPELIKILYFNDGFCKLLGYTRGEYERLSVVNPLSMVFDEDLPQIKKKIEELVQSGVPIEDLYRVHVNGGAYKWIKHKAVVADRNGDIVIVNAVLFDVTDLQETAEQLRINEEEHRLAVEHSGNIICRYNVADRSATMSQNMADTLSMPSYMSDIPYEPVRNGLIAAESADAYIKFFESIINGEKTGSVIFQQKTPRGWRWLKAKFSTIFSGDNKPISAVISFNDVTEQLEKEAVYKKWQQSLTEKDSSSYTLFRCNISSDTSFDIVEGSLLRVDFDSSSITFNERTEDYVRQCVFEEDRERYSTTLNSDTLLAGYYRGKRSQILEYRERLPEGGTRWLRVSIDLVEYPNSSDIEAYLMYENIDDSKRAELLTIERAERDPLTGTLNRVTFTSRVGSVIRTSDPKTKHALLMLDIDGFKLVNDAFGHGAGDQALIDIADAIRTAVRRGDLFGRLGGDEFFIFLNDIPDDEFAANKAKQICSLVKKSFSVEVQITGSIGIALCPEDGQDFDTLYKKADAALYYVKGSGKNNYAFYNSNIDGEHSETGPQGLEISPPEKIKRKRRMLIVDDNIIDFAYLSNIFADDFTIEKAKNGASALIRLRHYGSAISVVLLDLVMPGLDGFAVLERIQSSSELRTIPVIVVSADESRETGLRVIRSGASDFVTKPVDPELLRIRVLSAISKAENERLRAQNSFLELKSNELEKYRTVLEHTGTVIIEHDWVKGSFSYDPLISTFIGGIWNSRKLWHILLSDMVASVADVKTMQELVHDIAEDRKRFEGDLTVSLKIPSGAKHDFSMHIYKRVNEFQLTDKLVITFKDLQRSSMNQG